MKSFLFILSTFFVLPSFNAEAQFLKKLKDAVKEGIEAVDGDADETDGKNKDKGAQKATAASPPAKNGSTNPGEIPGMEYLPAPPDQNIQLPDYYQFSYRATLQITNSKGTATPVFYLEPDASYYARKHATENLTEYLVLDNRINMAVLYGEFQGEKRRLHNYFNLETKATLIGAYQDAPRTDPVTSTNSKTILGYECKGYQITTEAGTTRLWITDQAPASMFSSLFTYRSDAPDSPFSKNSMIMEVVFDSSSDPEKSYQMVCTTLQPEKLVLKQSDYQQVQ